MEVGESADAVQLVDQQVHIQRSRLQGKVAGLTNMVAKLQSGLEAAHEQHHSMVCCHFTQMHTRMYTGAAGGYFLQAHSSTSLSA